MTPSPRRLGVALGTLTLRTSRLIGAVALFSVVGGAAVAAVIGLGLAALPGSSIAVTEVTALTILAIALPTAGLHRLFGQAGLGLGAVLFLVVTNPASGNGTGPELPPGFWRQISRLMPPGAGGTGLRNVELLRRRPYRAASCPRSLVFGALLVAVADAALRRRARPLRETPVGRVDRQPGGGERAPG